MDNCIHRFSLMDNGVQVNFVGIWKFGFCPDLRARTGLHTADLSVSTKSIKTEHLYNDRTYSKRWTELATGLADHGSSFLVNRLEQRARKRDQHLLNIRFILPSDSGYAVRSDILERRMGGCQYVEEVASFLGPNPTIVRAHDLGLLNEFHIKEVLGSAIGALVLNIPHHLSRSELLAKLDHEIISRFSFDWILPRPAPRTTVVFVGPSVIEEMEKHFAAARCLNIALVLFEQPDGWLSRTDTQEFCDMHVFLDLRYDEDLPSRIVATVKKYGLHIDGILTLEDKLIVPVARAAQILGLTGSSSNTDYRAINKYQTRMLCIKDCQVLRLGGEDDLRDHATSELSYPLIVKPCIGQNSEGVSKVEGEEQLLHAVQLAREVCRNGDIIIETYIDGPEVDGNFILLDGEILFSELVDNFPCTADWNPNGNFLESGAVVPSALPPNEQCMARISLGNILKQLDLKTGMFHVEARIRGSQMSYTVKDRTLDLRPGTGCQDIVPTAFLMEVNCRPPAAQYAWMTEFKTGIDYAGVHLLCALGDKLRLRVLSQPFRKPAQIWCNSVLIPAHQGGVLHSSNICNSLRTRRPDLMTSVPYSGCVAPGTVLSDPASHDFYWVAWFCVVSQVSRQDALEIGAAIREAVCVDIRTTVGDNG